MKREIKYFSTVWCGPCKMVAPIIDEIKKEYTAVEITKIDADENVAEAEKFSIKSVPTFVFLVNGAETGRHNGYINKIRLIDLIKKFLIL